MKTLSELSFSGGDSAPPEGQNYFIVVGRKDCSYTLNAILLLERKDHTYFYVDFNDLSAADKASMNSHCGSHRTFPRVFYNDRLVGGFDNLSDFLADGGGSRSRR